MKIKMWKTKLAAIIVLIGLACQAHAATTPNSLVYTQVPKAYKAQITNASGTAVVSLAPGGTNGTKIMGLICAGTNTAAQDIEVTVLRSAVNYPLGTVTVPITAGTIAATPAVNMFNSGNIPGLPIDAQGNPFLFLESTDTLEIQALVTVTSGKTISCSTVAADF